MAIQLRKAPVFVTARSESGAVAADNAVINDTNYPPTSVSLQPHGEAPTVVGHWSAGGTVLPTDWIDVQLLYRNQKAATATWLQGPTVSGIRANEQFELPTFGCTEVALRVTAVSCAAGTNLVVMAASAPHSS